jgi:hypothetical protein
MKRFHGVLAALVCALGVASAARGAQPESCPTWFPDLQCDRHGRYEGWVAPMSMPYYLTDPFVTTGFSAYALWHDFPEHSVFDGGDLRVAAVQARLAITDRLGFVASKDGLVDFRPDLDLLDSEKGSGDLMAGFKYVLVDRPEDNFILATHLRYESTNGTADILQGNGEGVWMPGFSTGFMLGYYHVIAMVTGMLPVDGDAESTSVMWGLHIDQPFNEHIVPFFALSGIHYVDEGDGSTTVKTSLGRLPISAVQAALRTGPFEGVDYANLGSDGIDEHDYVTAGFGIRFPIRRGLEFGALYERPVVERRDVTKQRVTLNLLWEM